MVIILGLIFFIVYILKHVYRRENEEKLLIDKLAKKLIRRDFGGIKKMDKDIKKLARYIERKISESEKRMIEAIENRFDELEETLISEEGEDVPLDDEFEDIEDLKSTEDNQDQEEQKNLDESKSEKEVKKNDP